MPPSLTQPPNPPQPLQKGFYVSYYDREEEKPSKAILLIKNENIIHINYAFLNDNFLIIVYDLNNSVGKETIYEIYDYRTRNLSLIQGVIPHQPGQLKNIIYLESTGKVLILFANETHFWGINIRSDRIPNCEIMDDSSLNCRKCRGKYSQDMIGNCDACLLENAMSKSKKLCVPTIPHCQIYSDDNGNCEQCDYQFEVIPNNYMRKGDYKSRASQCSLFINIQMTKIHLISDLNPRFESFLYLNQGCQGCYPIREGYYLILWVESIESKTWIYNYQFITTKGNEFQSTNGVYEINPLMMSHINVFPNGNYFLTSYDSKNNKVNIFVQKSFLQTFTEAHLIYSLTIPLNFFIHIFNDNQFIVLYPNDIIFMAKMIFFNQSSLEIDQIISLNFSNILVNETGYENISNVVIIQKNNESFLIMWQDYSNLKYQEFSLNGSNVTSITNVTTIEPNLHFQYFSSDYLSDGRLIMVFGNDYPSSIENRTILDSSDIIYFMISGDDTIHEIMGKGGYNPTVVVNNDDSEFVIFMRNSLEIDGMLFSPKVINNCTAYDDTLAICKECESGYILRSSNDSPFCSKIIQNCILYIELDYNKCSKCQTNYKVNQDFSECKNIGTEENNIFTLIFAIVMSCIGFIIVVLIAIYISRAKERKQLQKRADYKIVHVKLEERTVERKYVVFSKSSTLIPFNLESNINKIKQYIHEKMRSNVTK